MLACSGSTIVSSPHTSCACMLITLLLNPHPHAALTTIVLLCILHVCDLRAKFQLMNFYIESIEKKKSSLLVTTTRIPVSSILKLLDRSPPTYPPSWSPICLSFLVQPASCSHTCL